MNELIDINKIVSLIPHRYPFILVDRVLDYKTLDYLTAIKNVTMNENFFTGHFPGNPIMPGVLMLEALAQASAILSSLSREPKEGYETLHYFAGIDDARFKQVVIPGDQLRLEVKLTGQKRDFWRMHAEAYVGDKLACSANLLSAAKEIKKVIDERAMIHPSAKLAKGVSVGPGTVIGADVEIGENTWIGPHVVIEGPTTIGKNNKIFQFASVGDEPQDITYKGEPTRLEIGDNNVIREYCMISRGTVKGGGVTRVGNGNFLMAYSHIGHDCMVGDQIIMVNYAALSGHVIVDDYAIIGPYAAVHQFCHVGAYAFIARATYVTKDVLPYVMIAGHTTSACGINTVGLRRRGYSSAAIDGLRRAYKIIFRKGLTVQQALSELELMQNECPEVIPLIDSLNKSTRGIVR